VCLLSVGVEIVYAHVVLKSPTQHIKLKSSSMVYCKGVNRTMIKTKNMTIIFKNDKIHKINVRRKK